MEALKFPWLPQGHSAAQGGAREIITGGKIVSTQKGCPTWGKEKSEQWDKEGWEGWRDERRRRETLGPSGTQLSEGQDLDPGRSRGTRARSALTAPLRALRAQRWAVLRGPTAWFPSYLVIWGRKNEGENSRPEAPLTPRVRGPASSLGCLDLVPRDVPTSSQAGSTFAPATRARPAGLQLPLPGRREEGGENLNWLGRKPFRKKLPAPAAPQWQALGKLATGANRGVNPGGRDAPAWDLEGIRDSCTRFRLGHSPGSLKKGRENSGDRARLGDGRQCRFVRPATGGKKSPLRHPRPAASASAGLGIWNAPLRDPATGAAVHLLSKKGALVLFLPPFLPLSPLDRW